MTRVPADFINSTAHEIYEQVVEHFIITCTLNVVIKEIQHDAVCDKVSPLKYMYDSFLLAEWTGGT